MSVSTCLRRTLLVLAFVVSPFSTSHPAAAQAAPTAVDGAADFRTAPVIGEGTFADEIVTGETVFYAAFYTNGTPIEVAARLADADPLPEDLTLVRLIISPTLGVLAEDDADLSGGTMSFSGANTNLWYFAFRLDTTGELGVRHELEFSLGGVESADAEPCGDDCELTDELAVVEAEVAELEDRLAECGGSCEGSDARASIETQITDAQGRLDAARADIVERCGGSPCEVLPASEEVSVPAIVVTGIAAVAGLALLARALRSRRAHDAAAPAGPSDRSTF